MLGRGDGQRNSVDIRARVGYNLLGEFMKEIAFVLGICAVAFFALSYLMRERRLIVTFALVSRILYVAQYLLLGAFAGAVLDVLSAISIALAQNKDKGAIAKYQRWVFLATNVAIVAAGIVLVATVGGWLGILPMMGVLLQTDALWLRRERDIRLVSVSGCPFWFAYNLAVGAYGSVVGDVLSFVSLTVSFIRYDVLKRQPKGGGKC